LIHGVKAQQVRQRLDRAFEMLKSAAPSDLDKMTELWAIMSDIQLWMSDIEQGRMLERPEYGFDIKKEA